MADTVKVEDSLPATTIKTEGAEHKNRKERNEEWRAKQRLARAERLKVKKEAINARREALGLKPGDPLPEDKDCLDAFKEQLPDAKTTKLCKKLHVLRREIKTKIKKVIMFEIQRIVRKMRRIKEGKLKPGERESDIAGLEERLEQVKALNQDGLIECAVYRIKKQSKVISEMIGRDGDGGKLPASPEVKDLLEQQLVRHLLAAENIKGAIRKHVLDLEGVVTEKNKKPYRDMMKEQRRVKNLKKYEARMQRAQARKERQQLAENEQGESAEDGGYQSASENLMYADKLGDFVSDDNISDADSDSVKRKSSKDDHETNRSKKAKKYHDDDDDDDDEDIDEEDFNKIYQGNGHKNRPGQRARRQKYEKMYGSEANHIKIMTKDKKPPKPQFEKKKQKGVEGPTVKLETSSKTLQQMHPSWEAKRREKQIMEEAKNVKGNKIVFD